MNKELYEAMKELAIAKMEEATTWLEREDVTREFETLEEHRAWKSTRKDAEIKYAINCGKRIVPVMLDNAPFGDGIRMDLTNTDQVDYNKPDEFSKKLQTSIGFILMNGS